MNTKIKKKIIAAVSFTAAMIVVYILLPQSTPSIYWQSGAKQMYRIDIRSVMFASHPSVESIHREFELHGVLNFRIYKTEGNIVKTGLQLSELTVKRGIIEDKAAEKLYSGLFFVNFSKDGKPVDFTFSNEIAPEDERILSDIIQSFQLVVKRSIFRSWTIEEKNINGTYNAQYAVTKGRVSKSKKKYIEVTDITGNRTGDKIEIKNSGIRFDYDNRLSWIKNAEGNDLIVFYSDGNPYLKISSSVKLTGIDFDPDNSLAIWSDSENADSIIDGWNDLPKNEVSLGQKSEEDALKAKFGNKTFYDIAGELFGKYQAFDVQCIQQLMDFLELHPEAALQFPKFLREKKLNSTQQIMLVHALERNGTDKAQIALSDIMLDVNFSKESRTQAAIAFGSIDKPTQSSIDNLWKAYENRNRKDDANANMISSTSVLALGSMAKNLENSAEEKYINNSKIIKKRIGADLESKKDLNTTVALIHAAGNTADSDMIDDIVPFFEDSNPRVRSAAVSSLVFMDDKKVNDVLTKELDTESDVNVRTSIVDTMYRKKATDDTVASIIEKIPSEDNDIVRGSMYQYLLKNRDMPGVKDALSEMLTAEKSAEHRKIISKALHTKKPASNDDDDNES